MKILFNLIQIFLIASYLSACGARDYDPKDKSVKPTAEGQTVAAPVTPPRIIDPNAPLAIPSQADASKFIVNAARNFAVTDPKGETVVLQSAAQSRIYAFSIGGFALIGILYSLWSHASDKGEYHSKSDAYKGTHDAPKLRMRSFVSRAVLASVCGAALAYVTEAKMPHATLTPVTTSTKNVESKPTTSTLTVEPESPISIHLFDPN